MLTDGNNLPRVWFVCTVLWAPPLPILPRRGTLRLSTAPGIYSTHLSMLVNFERCSIELSTSQARSKWGPGNYTLAVDVSITAAMSLAYDMTEGAPYIYLAFKQKNIWYNRWGALGYDVHVSHNSIMRY